MSQDTLYFLDCDTGIDDALALAYLLNAVGDRLVGIGTVSGNVSAARGADNTIRLLEIAEATGIPVAVGSHNPRAGAFDGGAPHVHGSDGVGGVILPATTAQPVAEPAWSLLARLAREHEGRLHIIAIGPLTNISLALDAEPNLPDLVEGITIMGGAVNVPGNITLYAEANIANDPEGAQHVLDTLWKKLTLVPLDVTLNHLFDTLHTQDLSRHGGPLAQTVSAMFNTYFSFYETKLGMRAAPLHDPLAAAIAVGDVEVTAALYEPLAVDTTRSPQRGQTRVRNSTMPAPWCRTVIQASPSAAAKILQTVLTSTETKPESITHV